MADRVTTLVETLGLAPHPEGGRYREVFRSSRTVEAPGGGMRAALTSIYFLLAQGERSRWHRVASDEVWCFLEGEPLELLTFDSVTGVVSRLVLGTVRAGVRPQRVVPAGVWQAARPLGAYSLVACSVGPGFEFADFALMSDDRGEARLLRALAPELESLI